MIYKFSPHLLTKDISETRIGVMLIQGSEPLFVIDHMMAEVFRSMNPERIVLEELLKVWEEKFESHEHEELRKHITGFIEDLIQKSLLVPHDQK